MHPAAQGRIPDAEIDARTRIILEAPLLRTIIRLAVPNAAVMVTQVSLGLIELYFLAKLGVDALLDFRQPAEEVGCLGKLHDRHAAMTIVGRKWDRLTKVMRQRVGTAGKTASSRDSHRDRVARYTILQCCRRTTRGRLHAEPTAPKPIAHSRPLAPCRYNEFRPTPRRS